METYIAQRTDITIDGDVLTLTRKKIGKDEVRRIPLAAITGVRLKPGGALTVPMLQLVLNDEPPADITLIEPNTLIFPKAAKYRDSLLRLHARLQAIAEHNRATGTAPVAYDAPRQSAAERLSESVGAWAERTAQHQAELDASRARDAALRDEVARLEAAADEQERVERHRQELAAEGITRDDVLSAALATTFMGSIPVEIKSLARMLRPDEPLLRAAGATFNEDRGLAAITSTRLIFLAEALFSNQVSEHPLTSISAVATNEELFANTLTAHLHAGQPITYTNVDNLNDFATTLREATPTATPQTPPPTQQDVLAQIAKLAELHTAGILTTAEFESKKTELLTRL